MTDSAPEMPAIGDGAARKSIGDWHAAVAAAEKIGDHLGACDAALAGLREFPGDTGLACHAVLNTSRTGGHRRARLLWRQFGLDGSASEEIAALGARLKREAAFVAPPAERTDMLREAAEEYSQIYRREGSSTFPGINAAALYFIAGDREQARTVAADILVRCSAMRAEGSDAAFHLAADMAAAELILGREDVAARLVEGAARLGARATAITSTRRQLKQICAAGRIDPVLLAALGNPSVIHFTGHMVKPPGEPGRFPATAVERVGVEIAETLARRNVGYGYGSLACGGDTLFAEALLARGGELNVVLPFNLDTFRRYSVETGGPGWSERFDRCLARAKLSYVTEGDHSGDPEVFAHCSRLAMGSAVLAAQRLDTDLCQIAVWDGQETAHPAGTWVDMTAWKETGRETIRIDSGGNIPHVHMHFPEQHRDPNQPLCRIRAMIFGDFAGFSKLTDMQTLVYFKTVLGVVAAVLDRHGDWVLAQNTWGDGLFVVLNDLTAAARCALELQSEIARIDMAALGLPATLGLRIGLHAGPVFEVFDPIQHMTGFAGTHISRTARIEPITPPGEVYVTEQFAALLSLEQASEMSCDYVGLMPAAKDYGLLRMYLLRHEHQM